MFRSSQLLLVAWLAFVAGVLPCSTAVAQTPQPTPSTEEPFIDTPEREDARNARLLAIVESIDRSQEDLRELQQTLQTPAGQGREDALRRQIGEVAAKMESLRRSFTELSSGVDPRLFERRGEARSIAWNEELQELLSPLLNEVKRATSRPREIDRLRTVITDLEERSRVVRAAITRIEDLLRGPRIDEKLRVALEAERERWVEQEKTLQTDLGIAAQRLQARVNERRSLTESLGDLSELFLKSRGRNLLVAFLATLLFWILLRRLQLRVHQRFGGRSPAKSFRYRLFSVVYLFMSGMGSIFVFLLVLFFFGDWVLLVLGLLFLLGLVWSSRQAVPRYWHQAALLMNMGPVREGERVTYNGLPWRVRSLNFYSLFENPELEGGFLRLPLRDLERLRSRRSGKDEPWFPTRRGDWVLLPDGVYGTIVHQGVDLVRVLEPGGSSKVYPTTVFRELCPRVLSHGFRVSLVFGLDHRHRSTITTDIREQLETSIRAGLVRDYCRDEHLSLKVEFCAAGARSLDFEVLADFDGAIAGTYQELCRALAKLAVEACNEFGWIIPFEQMTVHIDSKDPERK